MASAADTLRRCAGLICDGQAHPVDDPKLIAALQDSVDQLNTLMGEEIEGDISKILDQEPVDVLGGSGGKFASALDPGFHARALGIATEMVSDATLAAAGAQTVVDKRLGMGESTSRNFVAHCLSHLSFHSVWFRNAVRGAVGLALAVAVVEVTDVSHGFWVVLGTLSVLRSNALGTGATALRAIGGTAVGFLIGSAIMIGVSDHLVLLWFLLPIAVLVSGAAPAMISFAAGQAGFTVVVMILFNIIEPTGWKVGLTRIEDVAIGCAVSVVVGVLFWPRGATAALGRALSAAFVANSGYLADAVDRLTMTAKPVDTEPGQRESHTTYLLLDDAFRQFFAERGAKVVSVETVSQLFTGANRIRLAAYTLARLPTLPPAAGQPEMESVAVAGAVLRDSYASSHRWYQEFAELLAQRRDLARRASRSRPRAARGTASGLRGGPVPTAARPSSGDAADALGRPAARDPEPGAGRPSRLSRPVRQAAGRSGLIGRPFGLGARRGSAYSLAMARLDVPPGEGGDAVQIWSLQPAFGTAAMRLVDAAYNKSILPVRVREAARMRIAQLNECTVCLTFRADTVKEQGLGEDFYCVVGTPQQEALSEQEQLAVAYAERFALDHTSIDDEFMERLRGVFTDPEILDLTICLSAFLGLGRTLRALGITETALTDV